MKTYLLTSDKWSGEIELQYDDSGVLLSHNNRAQMSDEQNRYFLCRLPVTFQQAERLIAATSAKLTLVPQADVTFELFWQRYDDRVNSSKKRTLAKWQKMPKAEQVKAYNFIGKYLANIPHGTRRKFAETYLNNELWNN